MIIDSNVYSVSSSISAREFKHVIETLLSCDPEVKKDARYINIYEIATKNDGIDALVLLPKEELRNLHF